MKKIDVGDIVFGLFILALLGALLGIVYIGAVAQPRAAERNCAALSEEINRPTQYRNGACYVELCEGYWVREEDIIYSLDVCDGD